TAAFEEQVRRVLDNVSGAMELLKRQIEKDGASFDLAEWSRQIPELAASTVHIAVVSEDPDAPSYMTGHAAPPAAFLADAEHWRYAAHGGLFIGKPARDPVTNAVTLQIAKRIHKPGEHGYDGTLIFSLDPEFLTGLHRKIDLGEEGSFAL